MLPTFKYCAVLGVQGNRASGFKRKQGKAHCAKFEGNTNRMTFEYAPNMMIVKVHPLKVITTFSKFSKWDSFIHADSLNSSTVVPVL